MPGYINWAGLVTGAALVALGLEQTPITGRWQFIVRPTVRPWTRYEQGRLQDRAEWYYACPTQNSSRHNLQEQGLQSMLVLDQTAAAGVLEQGVQLIQSLYQTAAAGVNSIAATDASLHARLYRVPKFIVVQHFADHLLPMTGQTSSMAEVRIAISASAGEVLQHQTPEEMVWAVARELAHAIGRHQEERSSWTLLNFGLVGARIFMAVVQRACTFRGLLLDVLLIEAVFTAARDHWLPRQMQYDADALGAIISKAAGCSSAAIISGMQRSQVRAMLERKAQFPERAKAFDSQTEAHMAALQHLLPGTHLPDFLLSSRELFQAVQQATASQPPEVQQQVSAVVARLEQLQGERQFLLRAPFVERMLSRHPNCHPEWPERIRRVRQLLVKLPADPNVPVHARMPQCLKDASATMKLYQSDDKWSHLQGKQLEEGQRSEQVRKIPVAVLNSMTAE